MQKIIIPSKNIYHKNNPKIIDNNITLITQEKTGLSTHSGELTENPLDVVFVVIDKEQGFIYYFDIGEIQGTGYDNGQWFDREGNPSFRTGQFDYYIYWEDASKKELKAEIPYSFSTDKIVEIKSQTENGKTKITSLMLSMTIEDLYGNVSKQDLSSFFVDNYNEYYKTFTIPITITLATFDDVTEDYTYISKVTAKIFGDFIEENNTMPNLIGDGTKVLSLETNELVNDFSTFKKSDEQTVKTSEFIIEKTLDSYKNGKETATILCSISNYYDKESGFLAVGEKDYSIDIPLEVSKSSIVIASIITIKSEKTYPFDINVKIEFLRASGEWDFADITLAKNTLEAKLQILAANVQEVKIVSKTAIIPMIFDLHSQVTPMVMGADGTDRPMSKYKSGNPKVFEVVGSNIIYDGAVWQELTLQEVVEQ